MDYLSHNVAVNLHRIRKSRGMSLDLVAEQTGVSKSMLAQIEKDRANPSLGVLGKISSGLRVTVEELLGAPPVSSCIVHIQDMVPTKEVEGQYKVWTCFPYEDNQFLEIYRIEIEPGCSYTSGGHGENTMEYITVQKGKLIITCDKERHEINQEDILRFCTHQTHQYSNEEKEKVSFTCVFVDRK